MKVKSQPDIAKPSKLAPDDDRAEKLVVCKDLDDILSEFTEDKSENVKINLTNIIKSTFFCCSLAEMNLEKK